MTAAPKVARRRAPDLSQLARQHTGLVHLHARRFLRSGLEYDDLVQEGFTGLLQAAGRFDPSHGVTFATYAAYWIRARIMKAVECQADVGSSKTTRAVIWRLKRLRARMEAAGLDCDTESMAKALGVDAGRLAAAERRMHGVVRLDADTHAPGKNGSMHDIIPSDDPGPEHAYAEHEATTWAKALLRRLPEREQYVLEQRFEGRMLREVGDDLGLSRERVRQIEAKALRKLRAMARECGLSDGAQ